MGMTPRLLLRIVLRGALEGLAFGGLALLVAQVAKANGWDVSAALLIVSLFVALYCVGRWTWLAGARLARLHDRVDQLERASRVAHADAPS